MPDDNNDQREANEDRPKAADSGQSDKNGEPEPSAAPGPELEALIGENAELRDRLLRTMADMENLRRRTEREKTDTARYAISNFARDVLTIGDNLKRAVDHVPAEAAAQDPALKSFLDGVELTERELLNMLERHGVTRLDPIGERFDPNCHQAMYEVQNPDVPEGMVVDVMQAGYTIGDRCLRPALVAISKGGAKPGAQPAGKDRGQEQRKPANDDFPDGEVLGD
ncbi:MAG: nucleotide exchange factor GrpE [Methyloceanibacter sp.]|uniref:nucleotide exchange factor GrpE n=1 Tax=Methyloceanibacter sp. TaxID=1965321 RepID=UPI003D9BB48F